jgi:peptide/nickel transport system ATP-binding protein
MPRCKIDRPALREIAPGRLSACHLNDGTPPGAGLPNANETADET